MTARSLLFLAIAAMASPAAAAPLRDFCTTRPSLGTSACIVDAGHVVAEVGVVDWERDQDADQRTDTLLAGDALLRLGVSDTAEIQLGWTAFGHVRERDRTTGMVDRHSSVGDVMLAYRQNLRSPDGSGTSFGVQPFVTLPVGRTPVGAGTWGGGLVVPVSFELSDVVKLVLDPEVDAAPDEDGDGRHLRYGNVAGVELALSEAVAATLEFSSFRDRDPMAHATELLAALSLTWQPSDNLQLDVAAIGGLNHDSPDLRLTTGVSARF